MRRTTQREKRAHHELRTLLYGAGRTTERPCECGSKLYPSARYDARRIFLCYACDKCVREKLRGYRPEVLTDPNYEVLPGELGEELQEGENNGL